MKQAERDQSAGPHAVLSTNGATLFIIGLFGVIREVDDGGGYRTVERVDPLAEGVSLRLEVQPAPEPSAPPVPRSHLLNCRVGRPSEIAGGAKPRLGPIVEL